MRIAKLESWPEGAREGDIPYYAKWEDGSEYWALPGTEKSAGAAMRAYHGPFFGRDLNDLHIEYI